MADEKEFVLTREGKLELENELDTLKNVTRKEVSEKIKEARSFGDLSENAEYDEAKNEQAEVEARINEIEYMLKYARVIDDEEIKSDVVTPGSKVVLAIFGGEEKYTIVGSTEADPYKNKLSYESPIGAACLNRAAGETRREPFAGRERLRASRRQRAFRPGCGNGNGIGNAGRSPSPHWREWRSRLSGVQTGIQGNGSAQGTSKGKSYIALNI